MCGIAGILAADGAARHASAAIDAMRSAVRHRGPDDEGVWTSREGHAGFAHTRLSILDLTCAGHQPMQSDDGRLAITFNGEIYNFHELRHSLEQRGETFKTRTDTEVILKAYARDGADCIRSLRGMFALAIWDERERTCLLARDRFGIKPLYYHVVNGRLIFASEVKALLASGLVAADVDPDGVFGYFLTGSVPEPHTLVRDVKCLEAATYAVWRNGQLSSHRYWSLRFAADGGSGDPVAVTRRALVDSVTHHFVSDTPVGIFLSGGLDSTALLALSRDAGVAEPHTFSLAFPGEANDEGELASRTARHFGATHAEWAIDAATGRQLFSGFLRASDQPSIDGLNTFAVSKLAREHGMKVVLSGLGGDELFGGYPSFVQVPRLHDWHRRLGVIGPLRTALGRRLESAAISARWRRMGDLLAQPPGLERAYVAFRGVFTRGESRALTERYAGAPAPSYDDGDGVSRSAAPTAGDEVSRLELQRYTRNQLLRDSDTMSMASGLELRVPFLDGPLVDTLTTIPAAIRLQRGKRLLLQAVPEIPPWIAGQPKRGFVLPMQRWLSGEWRERFDDMQRSCPVRTDTWYRQWCVFVFERWLENLKRSQRE